MAYEIQYRDHDEELRVASRIKAWRAQSAAERHQKARLAAQHAAAHDRTDPFAYDRKYCHIMAGLHIGDRGTNH